MMWMPISLPFGLAALLTAGSPVCVLTGTVFDKSACNSTTRPPSTLGMILCRESEANGRYAVGCGRGIVLVGTVKHCRHPERQQGVQWISQRTASWGIS